MQNFKITDELIDKTFAELKKYAKNIDGRFDNNSIELTREDAVCVLDLMASGANKTYAMQEVLDGIIDILTY